MLEEYDYEVQYVPGPQNVVADCLSRINSNHFLEDNKSSPPENFKLNSEKEIYFKEEENLSKPINQSQYNDNLCLATMLNQHDPNFLPVGTNTQDKFENMLAVWLCSQRMEERPLCDSKTILIFSSPDLIQQNPLISKESYRQISNHPVAGQRFFLLENNPK